MEKYEFEFKSGNGKDSLIFASKEELLETVGMICRKDSPVEIKKSKELDSLEWRFTDNGGNPLEGVTSSGKS